jgi:hypothetical protein
MFGSCGGNRGVAWEGSTFGMSFEIAGRCENCVEKPPGKREIASYAHLEVTGMQT